MAQSGDEDERDEVVADPVYSRWGFGEEDFCVPFVGLVDAVLAVVAVFVVLVVLFENGEIAPDKLWCT